MQVFVLMPVESPLSCSHKGNAHEPRAAQNIVHVPTHFWCVGQFVGDAADPPFVYFFLAFAVSGIRLTTEGVDYQQLNSLVTIRRRVRPFAHG